MWPDRDRIKRCNRKILYIVLYIHSKKRVRIKKNRIQVRGLKTGSSREAGDRTGCNSETGYETDGSRLRVVKKLHVTEGQERRQIL